MQTYKVRMLVQKLKIPMDQLWSRVRVFSLRVFNLPVFKFLLYNAFYTFKHPHYTPDRSQTGRLETWVLASGCLKYPRPFADMEFSRLGSWPRDVSRLYFESLDLGPEH